MSTARLTPVVAISLLTLAMAGVALAGPFEHANEALARGDFAAALGLLRPLAEQGDAIAQYNLGVMYDNGQGVPQDLSVAMKWYRLAAEQGEAAAQNCLGWMYEHGRSVPQDYVEAVMWYHLGAEQGYAAAQLGLGLMYASGKGVPQDYIQAHLWCNLAAAQSAVAAEMAAVARDVVAGEMTPAQVAEAQRLASEWKPK